jgi:hypothetical protein
MKQFLGEWQKKVRLSHKNGKRGAKSSRNVSLAVAKKTADDLLFSSVSREMAKPRTAKSARRKRPNTILQIAGLV